MLRRVPPYETCGGATPVCRNACLREAASANAGTSACRHGLQPVGAPLDVEGNAISGVLSKPDEG